MRITFIKGSGKVDRMVIDRGDATESIECPKQRIIPHDMVHYAVESILHKRGFLGRVRDGEAADLIELYRVTCQARACAPLPVSADDILAVRARIAELDAERHALDVGQAVTWEL